jgi:hypothetical protein
MTGQRVIRCSARRRAASGRSRIGTRPKISSLASSARRPRRTLPGRALCSVDRVGTPDHIGSPAARKAQPDAVATGSRGRGSADLLGAARPSHRTAPWSPVTDARGRLLGERRLARRLGRWASTRASQWPPRDLPGCAASAIPRRRLNTGLHVRWPFARRDGWRAVALDVHRDFCGVAGGEAALGGPERARAKALELVHSGPKRRG